MENRMWWQTHDWVTYAKPSRRSTDPDVSTFSWRSLRQNYTKYISSVVSKILKKKKMIIQSLVCICDFAETGFHVVKVDNLCCQFFSRLQLQSRPLGERSEPFLAAKLLVAPNWFWRIFSMFLSSRLTITWRWKKNIVAISLMLNHNSTGLQRNQYLSFNYIMITWNLNLR